MIEQCLTVGEIKDFIGRDYNEEVSRKFNDKYRGVADSERITYGRFMGDLSEILHELGHNGRAPLVKMGR